MPVKRGSNQLTGGTGDVNPQTYVLQTTPIIVPGATTAPIPGAQSFPLPIPRYPAGNGRSIVFEVLEVEWFMPNFLPNSTSGFSTVLFAALTTDPLAPGVDNNTDPLFTNFFGNPRHISIFGSQKTTLLTTSGAFESESFVRFSDDLTDEAGHGILVATDNIQLHTLAQVQGPDSITTQVTARVSYRLKEVSLTEYIGIVQSQQ